jgi:hypothetical protein
VFKCVSKNINKKPGAYGTTNFDLLGKATVFLKKASKVKHESS